MEQEPPGLTRIRRVARLLDDSVGVPLTRYRVGLDALLGLVPVAGDTVTALLSLYIVVEAARLGVSLRTLARMVLNVGLDFAVGSVPVVGDLVDALWKANERNAELAAADLARADQTPF
ncbi:DUF4112 domain-containing protein [Haloarcula halophila]|uniref:DUF4112 domain-containing protein n=1 Tax=Haloarcula TaxID=2237 RepID=UPI0023E42E8B|nr:DUF4112 domain-containing protein [Halomicroarcula sp. DFY41]